MLADLSTDLVRAAPGQRALIRCATLDHLLKGVPITIAFFFEQAADPEDMTVGLAAALADHPHFAGRLKLVGGALSIDADNQGAELSSARHDCRMADKLETLFESGSGEDLFALIDPATTVPNEEPVLRARLNTFAGAGMCLGVTWYHPIGDMATFMSFMKSWADAVAGRASPKPILVLDRFAYVQETLERNEARDPAVRYIDDEALAAFGTYREAEGAHQRKVQFFFSADELERMRHAFREESGADVSRNDVLCGHLYALIEERDPRANERLLGMVVNYRPRVGISDAVVGNLFSNVRVPMRGQTGPEIAAQFRDKITHYASSHLDHYATEDFIADRGGIPNIDRFTFKVIDPVEGALVTTSWAKFGIYEPDFGGAAPFYVTQFPTIPFPGLLSVSEGFGGRGLTLTAPLPARLADELMSDASLAEVHRYRDPAERVPSLVDRSEWLG